jgi:hypothetical protein
MENVPFASTKGSAVNVVFISPQFPDTYWN